MTQASSVCRPLLPGARDADSVVRFAGGETIPYHHFSLALHKARRIALFTASNLDGSAAAKKPDKDHAYDRKSLGGPRPCRHGEMVHRSEDRPALPAAPTASSPRTGAPSTRAISGGQRGRRLGRSFEEVRFANGDTFHVTNLLAAGQRLQPVRRGAGQWGRP